MIDLSKIQYRFVIMDEKGNQYNIKDYVENRRVGARWKTNSPTRISFTTKNEKSSKEVFSDIAKLGCLVGIFASDGVADEEVARGNIIDWKPAYSSDAYKFDGKCYDNLYNLQESQDNIYYPAGTGTKSAVTKILMTGKFHSVRMKDRMKHTQS